MAFDSFTQPVHELLGSAGGRYELESLLGTGALGVVYLARQEHLDRQVAVKFLREPYAHLPQFQAALRREARAGCRIDHPNVTRTYDVGKDQHGRDFMVMECLRGASLESILNNVPCPPLSWTISIVSQVLAGLEAAHQRGVVHRDVKPGNVIVDTCLDDDEQPIDVAKLCDFGIAQLADHDGAAASDAEQAFDISTCGTPNYMSPEQAQGQPCTAQSDVYSCGAMLYEMVTGRPPFSGENPRATAVAHVLEAPPRPRRLRGDISGALERIILRALEKNPRDRFASAREMRAALLALPYARERVSLLDDWADMPTAERDARPSTTGIGRWPTLRVPAAGGARAAVLGSVALTLAAALMCHQLPNVQQWFTPAAAATAAASNIAQR